MNAARRRLCVAEEGEVVGEVGGFGGEDGLAGLGLRGGGDLKDWLM